VIGVTGEKKKPSEESLGDGPKDLFRFGPVYLAVLSVLSPPRQISSGHGELAVIHQQPGQIHPNATKEPDMGSSWLPQRISG